MKDVQIAKSRVGSVGLLIALVLLPLAVLAADNSDIDQVFDVDSGGTLIINSDAGPIAVDTWNRDEVRVRVRNTDGFRMEVSQQGNDVLVIADRERSLSVFRFGGSNIRFDVTIPEQYNVDLDTGGGSITVPDLEGFVRADTSGGSIDIGRITGYVEVDTSGGRITIADVLGDVSADTSGGRILIGDVDGDVYADTSGGDIDIGDVTGDIYADTSGGDIEVGEAGGSVELDTSGGTIRAGWAEGPVVADTSGGNIYLAGSAVSVEADTSGGNIEISRSDGSVYADTSGGSITIRQSRGPIRADTSGGRIDAELAAFSGSRNANIELESSGGDVTVRIPSNHGATILADLEVSRRARNNYRIYTDFPLVIQEDEDGDILGRGDINGGGDRIYIETENSDIHIVQSD